MSTIEVQENRTEEKIIEEEVKGITYISMYEFKL